MDISKVDDYMVTLLKKNGWYPGRKFDASDWIRILAEEGYEIHPYAHNILIELGELSIRARVTDIYNSVTLIFDALEMSGEFERLEAFEEASNDKLYPIGMLQQYFLYAGASRRIYIAGAQILFIIGDSIEDFLNNIIKKIYEPVRIL